MGISKETCSNWIECKADDGEDDKLLQEEVEETDSPSDSMGGEEGVGEEVGKEEGWGG